MAVHRRLPKTAGIGSLEIDRAGRHRRQACQNHRANRDTQRQAGMRINAAPKIEYPADGHRRRRRSLSSLVCQKNRAALDAAFLTKGEQSMLPAAPLRAREIAMNPSWMPRRMAMAIKQELSSVVGDRGVK